jgi:hypothetical protein
MRVNNGLALAAVVLFGAAGCNKSSTAAATTSPTVTRTTDTFTGTVAIGGSDFHSFPIAATGQIDVTLTAAAPPSTVVMGLSIGTPADGKCNALAGALTRRQPGRRCSFPLASPGALCGRSRCRQPVHSVSYTVTVTHP